MPESYGVNVARWEDDHPEWKLSAREKGLRGFVANRRDGHGPVLIGETLDGLAVQVAEPRGRPRLRES